MIISEQTKISLSQFLDLFIVKNVYMLFRKHKILVKDLDREFEKYQTVNGDFDLLQINDSLMKANPSSIETLIAEVVRTQGVLRGQISPKYIFDERWGDFNKWLFLDGFLIENKEIVRLEPLIESSTPVADDLTNDLNISYLESPNIVIDHIKLSAEAFTKPASDYNACLIHSRIARDTLVKAIAEYLGLKMENVTDSKKWGASLHHLKEKGLINCKEEGVISSIYTVISDGAHKSIGITEEDYVRFGRNLAMSICYFIIKKFNAKPSTGLHQSPPF